MERFWPKIIIIKYLHTGPIKARGKTILRFFKYNINYWHKIWNRVNDTDLQDRIWRAGVRVGFLDEVVAYVLPWPNEATVGLEAYKLTKEGEERHFSFKDD